MPGHPSTQDIAAGTAFGGATSGGGGITVQPVPGLEGALQIFINGEPATDANGNFMIVGASDFLAATQQPAAAPAFSTTREGLTFQAQLQREAQADLAATQTEIVRLQEGFPVRRAARTVGIPRSSEGCSGMSILELLVTLVIIALLAAISINVYADALVKSKVTRAIVEIRGIEKAIADHEANSELPDSLDDIGWGNRLDPWGSPYRYVKFVTNKKGKIIPGQARKDRFLVPLNSTYDLYSMGADGDSKGPLTAKASRDDILRASDGAFVGLASDF